MIIVKPRLKRSIEGIEHFFSFFFSERKVRFLLLATLKKKRDWETRDTDEPQTTKTGRFQTVTGRIFFELNRTDSNEYFV